MRAGGYGRLTPLPDPAVEAPTLVPGRHPLPVPGAPDALLLVPPSAVPAVGPRSLLVFCHGAGGSAAGAVGLIESAAAETGALVLLPSSSGRTWDIVLGAPGPDTLAVDAALQQAATRCAVDPHRVAIGGFSDGGSYALSLGLANGGLFGAVLAFSPGFLAAPRMEGRPEVFIAHGTDDRVLPVDLCGRRVSAQLRKAGYPVTYQEFDGGHVVPPAVAAAATHWWTDDAPTAAESLKPSL